MSVKKKDYNKEKKIITKKLLKLISLPQNLMTYQRGFLLQD